MTTRHSTRDDERRVAEIRRYDVLDHAPRHELLAIAELAAKVCDTSMATINLITDSHQHQVATYGFDAAVCRREDSMCAVTLSETGPLVVPDASLDARFRDNPFVTGAIGSVRFYASQRLVTPDGTPIGTLCVFDEVARTLDQQQVRALTTLADRVMEVLELSLRSHQLTVSNERLTAFAGRVSHDLKRPLTTVSLALGMLREQIDAGGEIEDAMWLVDRALSGADRMAAMIDQVLDYARFGGSLRAEPVDLDRVLTDVLEDLDGPLRDVPMVITSLPTVVGDEVQLRRVLQNLLDNAVKYRSPTRPLLIQIDAKRRGDMWRVSVADTGRGISPEDRERIFEPLVRLDDDDRGSGIGLDTSRRIVEGHGGAIGVTDTRGGGATVWFDIPVAD